MKVGLILPMSDEGSARSRDPRQALRA